MRRRLTFVFAAVAAALAAAGAAAASGGTSIANAPVVAPGAQLTGDTSQDATSPGDDGIGFDSGCWHDLEYWRLPLAAGDAVTFTGGATSPGDNFELGIFPPGTTDRTLANAKSVENGFPKQHAVSLHVVQPGSYVFVFGPNCYNGVDGPFALTVAVAHDAAPVRTTVELPAGLPASGSVAVSVTAQGGVQVTDPKLVLQLFGTWKEPGAPGAKPHLLGTASPRAGTATFALHLPASLRGTEIDLQVLGRGSGYAPVKSVLAARKVT